MKFGPQVAKIIKFEFFEIFHVKFLQIISGDFNFIYQFSLIPFILYKTNTNITFVSLLVKKKTFKSSKDPFRATAIINIHVTSPYFVKCITVNLMEVRSVITSVKTVNEPELDKTKEMTRNPIENSDQPAENSDRPVWSESSLCA